MVDIPGLTAARISSSGFALSSLRQKASSSHSAARAARQKDTARHRRRHQRDHSKEKNKNPTLRQTLEDHLAARKDLRPASVRVYRICVNTYLKLGSTCRCARSHRRMVEERHRAVAAEVADEEHGRVSIWTNVQLDYRRF
jgi:hypothetical protein